MNTEQKIEFISECLQSWEDWMHGEDDVDVGQCRIYLEEVKAELIKLKLERDSYRFKLQGALNNQEQIQAERDELKAENERLKEGIRNLKWFAFSAITSVGVANFSNYRKNAEEAKMFIADKISELLKEKP